MRTTGWSFATQDLTKDDSKPLEGYPGRRHQYADGSCGVQLEALDEPKMACLLLSPDRRRWSKALKMCYLRTKTNMSLYA